MALTHTEMKTNEIRCRLLYDKKATLVMRMALFRVSATSIYNLVFDLPVSAVRISL